MPEDKQLQRQLDVVKELARDPGDEHPGEASAAPLTEHGESSGLKDLVNDLHQRRTKVKLGGGREKIDAQHAKGKLTARERVDLLVDRGSFVEIGIHGRPHFSQRAMEGREAPADGVITGWGDVDGRA
jgi:acetyl-CoA carboxylase carboxyltransferase component